MFLQYRNELLIAEPVAFHSSVSLKTDSTHFWQHFRSARHLRKMMMRIETTGRRPEANARVLSYFRALPIAQIWGAVVQPSAIF
jgi:hypothetical protein